MKTTTKRNPYLTPGMETALRAVAEEDGDLVIEDRECYAGLHRTNVATAHRLLRLCLIKEDGENHPDGFERYVITSCGRNVLHSPEAIPTIVVVLEQQAKKKRKRK